MTNYKTLYSDIYNMLSNDDQTAFDSLNKELDKLHVTEDAKYEKLYNLAAEMRKHNQDYIDYYGQKTTDLAKKEAKKTPENTWQLLGGLLCPTLLFRCFIYSYHSYNRCHHPIVYFSYWFDFDIHHGTVLESRH